MADKLTKLQSLKALAARAQNAIAAVASAAADAIQEVANTKADKNHTHSQYLTAHQDISGKADKGHKHVKADITDFPTSMSASDVAAWAKAASKPSYTKSEVGLGNVDNTADSAKSVKYATSAGSASTATKATGVTDYGDTNRTITIGYAGNGATTSNLAYLAGYLTGGTQIKDVSKDVLKSWLGLGGAAYSATSAFAAASHTHNYAGSGSAGGAANSAVVAAKLGRGGNTGVPMVFNWAGQSGQPPWLWGGSDGTNMYVYNPSNFNVNYAASAGSVAWANVSGKPSIISSVDYNNGTLSWAVAGEATRTYDIKKDILSGVSKVISSSGTNYIRFSDGTQICRGTSTKNTNGSMTVSFDASFSSEPTVVLTPTIYSTDMYVVSTATTSFKWQDGHTSNSTSVHYVAIGRWK